LSVIHFGEFFDGWVLLHRGDATAAVELLAEPPESFVNHYSGMWRAWYSSAWAEAAVLAGQSDAEDRVRRARLLTSQNPVADAIVRRAGGLAAQLRNPGTEEGRGEMNAAASALREQGARYQWARTLVMLGGAEAERGASALAEMQATPTAWPPG
jgi:hypothetical protein